MRDSCTPTACHTTSKQIHNDSEHIINMYFCVFGHIGDICCTIVLFVASCAVFFSFLKALLNSVLLHCWLGGRKGIRPVKCVVGCWYGYLSDLHTAQLMSLSLASVKSRLVLPFWYRLTRVVRLRSVKLVCVCVIKAPLLNYGI